MIREFYMISEYSAYQWISFFFVYSFMGWVFESTYVSIKVRHFTNIGFLKGPCLPIYGSGAVMMLFVAGPFQGHLLATYFAGIIGATLLELATGAAIEAIFKVRYWDYSGKFLNYHGYICLSSSITWGFFTVGLYEWLHPAVLYGLEQIPDQTGDILFALIGITFLIDALVSVREAADLRNLLLHLEDMRYELQLLKKRADVVMAVLDDEWHSQVKDPAAERLAELRSSLEGQIDRMKGSVSRYSSLSEAQRAEVEELQKKFSQIKGRIEQVRTGGLPRFRLRIMGNPSMMSERYRLSLDSVKHRILEIGHHQDE